MGKITGFLEYERNDRHYEPAEERIKHWREFVLPLPEEETRTQAARCMDCGIPYCHGTNLITGAPTGRGGARAPEQEARAGRRRRSGAVGGGRETPGVVGAGGRWSATRPSRRAGRSARRTRTPAGTPPRW